MWTMKLQGHCFSKVSNKFSQQALKALKHFQIWSFLSGDQGIGTLFVRYSLSLSLSIRCHYKGAQAQTGVWKHTQRSAFEGCNFNHIMIVKSHSMSSMMRKPGKVTLPTAHYSHQKTSQSKKVQSQICKAANRDFVDNLSWDDFGSSPWILEAFHWNGLSSVHHQSSSSESRHLH